MEEIHIPGYNIVSRRDRKDSESRGGIITYARQVIYNIVCIKNSVSAERSCHYLHLDVGTFAICNWYRPPASSDEVIATLQEEMSELKGEVVSIIIMGDCNMHHARWLRYSSGNSAEGVFLKQICDDYNVKQLVDKPARGEYLLDLVLTDLDDCKVQVLDQIADHRGIVAKLELPIPKFMNMIREVWHFKNASWSNLRCDLRACSWARLSEGSVDSAVNYFLDLLIAKCKEHIPFSRITFSKQTHPWIDEDCVQAINANNEAVGTDHFPAARDRCAEIINEKFQDQY